jgi:DUF4097 and DUF4098 domain-containing protein YvlB
MSQKKYKSGSVCAVSVMLALGAGLLSVGAMAQEVHAEAHGWVVTLQGNVEARRTIDVELGGGAIEVHGKPGLNNVQWAARVHVRGGTEEKARRIAGEQAISVNLKGDRVEFRSDGSVDLVVTTPVKLESVRLQTGGGGLTLTDVAANARLDTGGGKIEVDRLNGQLKGVTGGGDISLKEDGMGGSKNRVETGAGTVYADAMKGDWWLKTAGGNVVVTATSGNLQIETDGGNVTVRQVSGNLGLETAAGNIDIGDVGGSVSMETDGGSIRLASARGMVKASSAGGSIECRQLGTGLSAETASGAITAEFAKGMHFVPSSLQTASGDVMIFMPVEASAAVKLTADNPWGHSIQVDFPTIKLTSMKEDGQLRAEGLLNGGGPLLRAETGNGSVRLMKTK